MDWARPIQPHERLSEFMNMKGKLRMLAEFVELRELQDLVDRLETFQQRFLEYREPWKTTNWSFHYQKVDSTLKLFDKRKTLVEEFKFSEDDDLPALLQTRANTLVGERFMVSWEESKSSLGKSAKVLPGLVHFKTLLEDVRVGLGSSLIEGFSSQWDDLMEDNLPNGLDVVQLAFLGKIAIEIALKSKFSSLLPLEESLTLGECFERLQENGSFLGREPDIEEQLDILNGIIRGERPDARKGEIIDVKNKFKSLLQEEGVNLML